VAEVVEESPALVEVALPPQVAPSQQELEEEQALAPA
jgi:hypothetical protein